MRRWLQVNLLPLAGVQVVNQHVLRHHTVFCLASIDDHARSVDHSGVILTRADRDSFRFDDLDGFVSKIKLKDLVGTLSDLSLTVELEAATEHIQRVFVADA